MAHLQELLNKADLYKDKILTAPEDIMEEALEKNLCFRSEFIYNINSLAGSSITLSETRSILEDKIEQFVEIPSSDNCIWEITDFSLAYEYILELSRQETFTITDEIIKNLHRLLFRHLDPALAGCYRKEKIPASTVGYTTPEPEDLPRLMSHLGDQILSSRATLHPVELAAMAHKRLMDIYPFKAGNLQVAMLLMNFILIKYGYCTVSIPSFRKTEYLNALSASRESIDMNPFSILIAECTIDSSREYCRRCNI